ncbi:hypothetical protein ACFLXN_02175 [Chloroflexota bacterium]
MKHDKRLARVRRNVTNVSLGDFESLARAFGEIEEGGKHPKVRIGKYPMPYKRENPIKSCYVVELLKIIDANK